MTSTPAPDFERADWTPPYPPYPSSTARMGPAWQAVWDLLADGAWHRRSEVLNVGTGAADPPLQPRTMKNLLRDARRAGYIKTRRKRNTWWDQRCV